MKLYTPLINKTLKIAYDAHHGQLDKSGAPYIYHPAFLAAQMDTEEEIITALLHDVVEDTDVTLEVLKHEGFPQPVLDALALLTHQDDSYWRYIERLVISPLAVKIKMADLRHNGETSRNANLPKEEAEKYRKKYSEAIQQLEKRVVEWADRLRKAENGDAREMFGAGVEYYGGYAGFPDKRKAFDLLSRAMETGLPKDRMYVSDDHSELHAARFLAVMILRDDDRVVSKKNGPFWFEKPPQPYEDRGKEWNDHWDEVSYEERYQISLSIREIFRIISAVDCAARDILKAEDIAQSIVLKLSFGDRDHNPAIELRTILQQAAYEKSISGKVELSGW